ncbi:MAG: BatA domain-containing protein [Brevinematales bacterium]|nr:BatA domain-containing protein [Brevinematales bacterium]
MRFLNPFFLYFLPLALIPILFYLIEKLNRKKIIFSSIELIEEILKEEKNKISINIFLKQILRTIILSLIILSFSRPVIEKSNDFSGFVAIIDPSLSMSDFDLREIVYLLREKGVKKILFGEKEITDELVYKKNIDLISLVNSIPENKILLITDAQKSNFKNLSYSKKDLTILLLYHTNKNYYFTSIEIYPEIITKESEIFVKAIINSNQDLPISIYINEKLIYQEKTNIIQKFLALDQSILKRENKIKIKIEATDFKYDNEVERNLFFSPKIKLFINLKDLSTKQYIIKTMRALFVNIEETFDINSADIIFLNNFDPNNIKLIYTLPEDFNKQKISFSSKNDYSGKLTTDFGIEIENFSLKSVYDTLANPYNLKPIAHLEKKPIIYKIKDNYLFAFSIKDNLKEMIYNPFLPIFFYETIKNYYNPQEKYKIELESIFEFIKIEELKKNFKVFEYTKTKNEKIELFLFLIMIGFILFVIDLFT